MNRSKYKRYEVIEEYGICEGCASYKNVVVGIRGYGLIDTAMRLFNRMFPKPEPEAQKIEWMETRELNDEYLCGAEYCDKELIDNAPPCADCDKCIAKEDTLNF